MKKTIKTAVAMLLALIMACGSMTAFASSSADIEWNFYEDETNTVYSYAGEIEVDADAIDLDYSEENDYMYYTFEAEEDGYYFVKTNGYCWSGIPEKFENGVYLDVKEYTYAYDYEAKIYYLEAGEHIIGFDMYEEADEEVAIEFLGDIINFDVEEDIFDNLIMNNTVFESDEESDSDYWVDVDTLTVEFESGKDIVQNYATILIFTDDELTKGEYEVEIGIYGIPYRQKMTINVADVRDIITKVELEDVELYTDLAYYYNSECYNSSKGTEDLIVTYSDGTTEVVEDFDSWCWLDSNIEVNSYYDMDENGNWCFIIEVAGVQYYNEVCTERFASKIENIFMYHAINMAKISRTFEWMGIYFNDIFRSDSISEAINSIGYFFSESTSDWLYAFASISENTAWLFDYMF